MTDIEQEVIVTKCGHVFHKNCIQRWLSTRNGQKKSCPTCRLPMSSSEQELPSGPHEHWKCGECSARMSASCPVMECLGCHPTLVSLCPTCVVLNHQSHKLGIVPLASSEALQEGLTEMRGWIADRDAALEGLRAVSEDLKERLKRITESLKQENHVATEALAELSDASTVPVRQLERLLALARGNNSVIEQSTRIIGAYDYALALYASPSTSA
uniref:RING-type domain-containing protein n=1 Tax=Steinernema glaseri TaxID=37863 RepID=A0A1I8AK45_9BILA